jgi:membrane protease YdiL (CAAX protease family)
MLAPIHIRYLLTILFTGIYISLGFILKLEATSYLILGIPLTLLFQLFIVRQPLHKLWLRDKEKFQMNKSGWAIALCFAIFPIYQTIELANTDRLNLINLGYYSAAIFGSLGAGYCFSNLKKQTIKDFLLCFFIIVVIRMSWYFFPFLFGNQKFDPDYIRGIKSLLTYIPVAFVVEEVIFRGMLDSYIYQSKTTNGLWSAIFISSLWGLWHLPLSQNINSLWIVILPLRACVWGICLSIFWRRTGNLAVPVFPHAFADAVRDSFI